MQDFKIDNDVIVISTPEIAGLPYVVSGLVAAGGLAAALSTADGLLLAIANALSHDVYYKMIDPNAATARRLVVARVLLLFVAVAAALVARTKPADILAMVAWAFSLAAAGNFPALVLGVWWKRATAPGAILGMIAGFGICLFYLIVSRYFPLAGMDYFGMTPLVAAKGPAEATATIVHRTLAALVVIRLALALAGITIGGQPKQFGQQAAFGFDGERHGGGFRVQVGVHALACPPAQGESSA